MNREMAHTIGVILVIVAGLIAVANGIWFIFGDHPFDDNGYSEEVDLTYEEAWDVTPELADWLLHVADQVGSVTVGWGLFVVALAALEYRRYDRTLQLVLFIGGFPTLLFSAFGEFIHFGTMDTGTMISMGVLTLFLIGFLLIYVGAEPGRTGNLE